jgi:hypothetical protein
MTEDEARLKQCCGPENCGHFNDNPYPARWCNTTACMAWRWREAWWHGDGSREVQQGEYVMGSPVLKASATDGFCGLAGR